MEILTKQKATNNKQKGKLTQDYQYYFKMGNYQKIRDILNTYSNKSTPLFLLFKSRLDTLEYNYNEAQKSLNQLLSFSNYQQTALLTLAQLSMNTGDYDIAELMLETLKNNDNYYINSLFSKIHLYIYQGKLYEAYDILKTIDFSKLLENEKKYYRCTEIYIKYYLGELTEEEVQNITQNQHYMLKQIVNPSLNRLLKHIAPHFISPENENGFISDVRIKSLISDLYSISETKNPDCNGLSYNFRLRFERQIGIIDDIPTNDVCAVFLPNTDTLITLYPILFSEEFNKEGLLESKELKFKRIDSVKSFMEN